uniref:ATP synthase complex subunit 8 n=1 Tax=Pseudoniphargus gorbeanus TaxID=1688789 RepID=A0A0M6X6G1_9CRUS|nr:ATP synthase F0 subunit 8 [Pseudoniphargus gorbeanus]
MPQMAPNLWILMLIMLLISLLFLMNYVYFLLPAVTPMEPTQKTMSYITAWAW